MLEEETLAINFLRRMRGIKKIKLLNNIERETVLRIEKNAEKTGNFYKSVNEGVKEALSRKYALTCITDTNFKWPPGPYSVLMEGNVIVGYITDDIECIKKQFNEKISVIGKNLVLFPERVKKLETPRRSPTVFVFKGSKMPELELEAKVKNAILSFPSRDACKYILKLLKEPIKPGIGSIIVGFDI
jgi:hypothetical protein